VKRHDKLHDLSAHELSQAFRATSFLRSRRRTALAASTREKERSTAIYVVDAEDGRFYKTTTCSASEFNVRFAPRAAIPQAASLLQQKSQNGFLGHEVKLNTRYNPAYVRFARRRHQLMSTVRHGILESPSDDQLWGPAMDPIHPL
jgi:hypothetical protein